MKFDVIADWTLNTFCNFSCPYCYVPRKDRRHPANRGHHAQEMVSALNTSQKTWLVHMSGGEPFFYHGFLDLCQGITEKHYISLNTNLSLPSVYAFCEKLDPERVSFVHCSLHITERVNPTQLSDFADKIHALESAGFLVYATQVMWPPIVGEFKRVFDFFQTKGIVIRPKVFKGYYRWREYPGSYTGEEKNTILTFMNLSDEADERTGRMKGHINPDMDRRCIDGYISFRGMPCSAGSKFVIINCDGTVRRCHSDPAPLGNINRGEFNLLKKVLPCKAKICGCPYYGFSFASGKHKVVKSRVPLFIQRMLRRK
jgi:MoaA/NifB/PqqE/SkfB family radical SAM enzyme